jgi:hypothetical protein
MSNVVELKKRFMTVQDLVDMGRYPHAHVSCCSCLFWIPGSEGMGGTCRALPPEVPRSVNGRKDALYAVFPITTPEDFCASWQGTPDDL